MPLKLLGRYYVYAKHIFRCIFQSIRITCDLMHFVLEQGLVKITELFG